VHIAKKGNFSAAITTRSKIQKEQEQYDIVAGNNKEKIISFIRSHPIQLLAFIY
jgi:hypothetical protein